MLMFFISSGPARGMSSYVTMMSGVKCHPHIRGMAGENNNPHHHYTGHENQSDQMVASTPRIETQHLPRHDPSCVTEQLSIQIYCLVIPKTGVRYHGGQQWALSVVPVTGQTYLISPNILPLLPLFKLSPFVLTPHMFSSGDLDSRTTL